jgi:drug/metabolite transporter (DMT)-like permease
MLPRIEQSMTWMGWQKYLFIAATVGFTAFGQLIIKARALAFTTAHGPRGKLVYLAAMFVDPGIWVGLGAAGAASVCWVLAVQRLPLSFAYPFMALTFLLVPSLSAVLFREAISPWQAVGLVAIVAGVVLNSASQ